MSSHIANETVRGVQVSTVRLIVDHSFGGGEPIWFETMTFGEPYDQFQYRYHTEEEALSGHAEVVAHVEAGTLSQDWWPEWPKTSQPHTDAKLARDARRKLRQALWPQTLEDISAAIHRDQTDRASYETPEKEVEAAPHRSNGQDAERHGGDGG